jgi:hypothetical protein
LVVFIDDGLSLPHYLLKLLAEPLDLCVESIIFFTVFLGFLLPDLYSSLSIFQSTLPLSDSTFPHFGLTFRFLAIIVFLSDDNFLLPYKSLLLLDDSLQLKDAALFDSKLLVVLISFYLDHVPLLFELLLV